MRAILLNDTRSEGHIGCELVVRNTLEACRRHGIEITGTIVNADAEHAAEHIVPYLKQNDLVLLNGEGSLHDDKPRTKGLLEAAVIAKKAGLKTVLYNALWSNNPEGRRHLSCFDLIYCRDSRSAAEILDEDPGLPVRTVQDMIFATPVPGDAPQRGSAILVTDSVRKKKSIALARHAIRHGQPFAAMGSSFGRRTRSCHLLKWRLARRCGYEDKQLDTPQSFIRKIQASSGVLTGRFHAACLALLLETPVCCLSSNTRKIEALYADFGLSAEHISEAVDPLGDLEPQWREQTRRREEINKRISRVRGEITSMFEQISHI